MGNVYNDNIRLVNGVSDTQRAFMVVCIVFYILIIIIINMFINLYLNINIERLFTKKIMGYYLYERYNKLIFFIGGVLISTTVIVFSYVFLNKFGFISVNNLLSCILLYIITGVIVFINLKRLEKQKINQVLKGERLL
jgi:hypothetical protein